MRSRKESSWMQTFTGKQFWPLDPKATDVCIYDIAHSLAMQCRFTGHCLSFYSVAQHSVMASYMVPSCSALWGLMHDASEAYLTDFARPLKLHSEIGSQYQMIESKVMAAVCERFGLSSKEPSGVREADDILLATERRDLMKQSKDNWGLLVCPMDSVISPWTWEESERRFLRRFAEIYSGD